MARRSRRHSPNGWLLAGGLLLVAGLAGPTAVPANTIIVAIAALLCFVAVACLSLWAWNGYRRDRLQDGLLQLAADQVDTMHHDAFEKQYVPALLRKNGYRGIRTTPATDHGIDVLARRDGVTYGIQVKHTRNPLGRTYNNKPIQEAVAGIKYHKYRCDRAMVVTNGYFSKRARELAKDCGCVLIDRDGLAQLLVAEVRAEKSHHRASFPRSD